MQKRAFSLMKLWCDTLLSFEVRSNSKYLDGSLLCPACHVVHGRIADLAFPLSLLYVRTGEKKYLDAADRMIDWTEFNLARPDGSWRNDAGSEWKATSAFSALSIGESLLQFGNDLPPEIYEKWMALFRHLSDYINRDFLKIAPVINYYAGAACEQAMAWKLTGEQRYLDFAHDRERICRTHFDENGLFFGEGFPLTHVTQKGCRYIDIGYNLEESLPLLIRYATLTGEQLDFYRDRCRDHLEFLLPDGGINNSWGSRHNKWTWWGSRTSDGAIEGFAHLLDEPLFADACERVLTLYEQCTCDGLLSLPMAKEAGEPTCLHHSFCHAKALATLVLQAPVEIQRTVLPTEQNYGIKLFQNGNVALISHNGWHATVSNSDARYLPGSENGSGSMTLLMHGRMPICAATMQLYTPTEPLNMQYLRKTDQMPCMTPRLVFENGNSLTESGVSLEQLEALVLRATGQDWAITYSFRDAVTIAVESARPAKFILPIICSGEAHVGQNRVKIGNVMVEAENLSCDPLDRGFNQVGGFIYQPLSIDIKGTTVVTIRMEENLY